MKLGMLWLDDDKKMSVEARIARAAEYYREKYGHYPNSCLVNSSMLDEEEMFDSIVVTPVRHVLPNHFWLGKKSN